MCTVGDYVIIGGGAAVHPVRAHRPPCLCRRPGGVENDVIPYGMALGNRAYLGGLNIVGMKRRGFSREDIHTLRRAYRALFADRAACAKRVEEVAAEFEEHPGGARNTRLHRQSGKRSICTPGRDEPRGLDAMAGGPARDGQATCRRTTGRISRSSAAMARCRVEIASGAARCGPPALHDRHRGRGGSRHPRLSGRDAGLGPARQAFPAPARNSRSARRCSPAASASGRTFT